MVGKKLIAFVAFVMLITLLEQIKSGVHAGRMTKPKRAGRVKVIHTGPRVRKLKKKVEELEKQLASMEQCERKKHFTSQYYSPHVKRPPLLCLHNKSRLSSKKNY